VTADKVVDASAFAAVTFLDSDFTAVERRLDGATLHAPALLRFEMANVCLKKLRVRPAERDIILRQYASSLEAPIMQHEIDFHELLMVAERLKLTAYDASYLWLAKQLNCELVTLDTRLAAAAVAI
jgi:predicted nucleic acid-binding protein